MTNRTPTLYRADLDAALKAGALTGGPVFYRITVETIAPDVAAIQRQSGLEAMLSGNAVIADAMSPERGYGTVIDTNTHYIGMDRMMNLNTPLASIMTE